MNFVYKISIVSVLFLLGSALYAGSVTIIGKKGALDFDKYALNVHQFSSKELSKKPDTRTIIRVSQKIDQSKLLVLGPRLPISVIHNIFNTPEIRLAITNFLRNGGTLFIASQSWRFYGNSGALNGFMKEAGLPRFNQNKHMCGHPDNKNSVYLKFKGKVNPAFKGAWAKSPNKDFTIQGLFSFADLSGTPYQVVVKDDKFGQAMVIEADKVFEKGRIIFAFSFDIMRRASHPFMINLLTDIFGPLRKTSTKEYLRNKINMSSQTQTAAPKPTILDLRQEAEVHLKNFNNKKVLGTTVKVSVKDKLLNVTFICKDPNPSKLKAKISGHDQPVYIDDSVEIMLSPGNKRSDDFYHIIVNSKGAVLDEKNGSKAWNPKYDCSTRIDKNSWTVKMSIPIAELGIKGKPFFMINFGRVSPGKPMQISSWTKAEKFSIRNVALTGWAVLDDPEKLYSTLPSVRKVSNGKVTIWQLPAFERIYQDTFPDSDTKDATHISFLVAQNDKECRQLLISNTTQENLYFRVEPNRLLSHNGGHFSETFEFCEVIPWMSSQRQVFGTGVAKLNAAGIIAVPSMETRQLWINAKTKLPPGKYNWAFQLVPTNSRSLKKKEIKVYMEVANLRYPDVLPLVGYTWGPHGDTPFYPRQDKYSRENYLRMAKDYHMTMIMSFDFPESFMKQGKASDNLDDYITLNDELCRKLDLKHVAFYRALYSTQRVLRQKNPNVTTEETIKVLKKLLKNKYAALKKHGYDPKNYYFPFFDEPLAKDIDLLIRLAKMTHKITPEFKVFGNFGTWTTQDEFHRLKDSMDVIVPHLQSFSYATAAEQEEFFRTLGKPYITYTCNEECAQSDNIHYFRSKGIRHYQLGAHGIGCWGFNFTLTNDWYPTGKRKTTFIFHHGNMSPVPTVHAEAFREAFEDMYLLHLAEKSSDPKVKALSSSEYLKKVQNATKQAAKAYQDWRDALTRALAK